MDTLRDMQQVMEIYVHIQRIKNEGVWSTHMELLVATDYYRIPAVYICGPSGNLMCIRGTSSIHSHQDIPLYICP